ncbi:ankyrin repeat family protein [Tanacetum coccineum]
MLVPLSLGCLQGPQVDAMSIAGAHSGETPLIHAARQGPTSTAKYLIEHGANLALSSELGATALHHVAGIADPSVTDDEVSLEKS